MEEYVIELPVCRVCLQASVQCIEMDAFMTNELGDEENQTYLECFRSCTNLDINTEDGMPKHICSMCALELRAAYDFIAKAKNSHDLLMQVEDVKPEYIVHEIDQQTNDLSEETIFLPIDNVEEIFEEETDDFYDMVFKEESVKVENKDEEQEVEVDSQPEETESGDNREEVNSDSEKQCDKSNKNKTPKNCVPDQIFCNLCHLEFDGLDELREHGEYEHGSLPFCCTVCCHRFRTKYTLADHVKRKHDDKYVTCDICESPVRRSFLPAHKRTAHRAPFLCSACPRTFKTTTGLQIHSETHKENRERNFECEHCHKRFLTLRTYKVHVRTHWHREPFKCNLCDKQFMQKVNLRLHMQMHRGETMDCLYCEKKFVRKTDLSVHLRFHTGNFPYECQYCDKRFAIVSHLNYHQKRHQGFMYKCDVCKKEFINMSGLRNHSFQHTAMPYFCVICDKGFPTRFKIKRHLKTVHHVEDLEELERCISTENIKLDEPGDGTQEEVIVTEMDRELSVDE